MRIHYDTMDEMIEIVRKLVVSGLTFNVIMAVQTIELTGGY